MRLLRSAGGALAAALALVLGGGTPAPASSASPPAATYNVTVGAPVPFANPTDTLASPYVDKDSTFHYQQSAALYGANDPRTWDFYTGTDFDTATFDRTISEAANPANPDDRNDDTTWRCNNSPTGREATYAPSGSGYAQRNYRDLSRVWVDPDTGDWYGLVHNEFTPRPFGDRLHYDAIDYAVSTDQGRTWTIKDHVITSPYSTERGDTAAFPQQTYHYGDGDQRLFVDTASGYFYVYYGSRIVEKNGGWKAFHEHVARAPISAKMAPGSWRKWYDGAWSRPGTGGRESNMVPVDDGQTTGYTPVSDEYDPANSGTVDSETGIVTGTPTTEGTTTVKVTATSGSAAASTSFDWTVEPVLTGPHTLTTSGRALDVPDHSTDPGTQLVTWIPNGGANQTWEFSRQPDGSYEITNSESHLCMDVNGGSTSAGAAIIQWTCTGGTNQRWTVTAVPAGHTLTSLKSGLLLTTASTADGAPVTQEADSGSVLQHWSLG
ncbi:RICIN domain-containing protein [Streptomyces sp. NPDC002758]